MTYEEQKLHHTPWVEKYRPKSLSEVSSQDHATRVLSRSIQSANLPHMLFYGPPGTGKTSTILALAKQLYGPRLFKTRVLELNASDERGIAIVRQKIKTFARLAVSNPSAEDAANYPCPPYKIIILDEADSMTNDAQSALRRTIENYSGITRFCLVCNYITRIIDPLASRCSKFRFKPLADADALARLSHVAQNEALSLENDTVLENVLRVANGDLRRAITYLQSASKLSVLAGKPVTAEIVHEIAGVVPPEVVGDLVAWLRASDTKQVVSGVAALVRGGHSAQQLVEQLHEVLVTDDGLGGDVKCSVGRLCFECDARLNGGADEHVQLLSLCLNLQTILNTTSEARSV